MRKPEEIKEYLENRIQELEKEIKVKQLILSELKKVQSEEDLPF